MKNLKTAAVLLFTTAAASGIIPASAQPLPLRMASPGQGARQPTSSLLRRSLFVSGCYINYGTPVINNAFILHGVNFDPIARGIPSQNEALLGEVAKSGANAVRLPWNPDANATVYSLANLEIYLKKCTALNIVPIVDYHGVTTSGSTSDFTNKAMAFWLNPQTKAMLLKYQNYLIINVANEWGKVDWADGDKAAAYQQYSATYVQAIKALRSAGYNCPLMIDAPDGAANEQRLIDASTTLMNADPQRNLVFGVHTYWWKYNGQPRTIVQQINAMKRTGYCFLIGELANIQDSGPIDCMYDLDQSGSSVMEQVLSQAKEVGIGWLAWEWHTDSCKMRELTTDGNYGNLTAQGQKIINNTQWGLGKISNPKVK